jgi:ABC-2 type transport system ATP-binding protein
MGVAERLCDRIFMIYKGKKVLDGTLDEIQSVYGFDTIRVESDAGLGAFEGLDGIDEINDQGNTQEVRYAGDPQDLLRALVDRARITRFEIARPSLHDVFVRIAAPESSRKEEMVSHES